MGSRPIADVVDGPGKRCDTVINALRHWQITEVREGLSGFRGARRRAGIPADAAHGPGGPGWPPRPAGGAGRAFGGRRWLATLGTSRLPLTSVRHRADSFLDNDVGRVGFGRHGNR